MHGNQSQVQKNAAPVEDKVQQRLVEYADGFSFSKLPSDVIHTAKVRVIDTLGVLVGGFFGKPCSIARNLAAQMPCTTGATILGTCMKTTPDFAAFANATAARYLDMNDGYHRPGIMAGHPSDAVAPLFGVCEHTGASGRDLITAVVLAYEIHLRTGDAVQVLGGFDYTNYVCMGIALAAGKTMGLSKAQLAHCISMAAVPNNALLQSRTGHLTMWKAAASGQAGRAGVFAAMLARSGMEGPHLPFEGKAGWCDHVAHKRYDISIMGGKDVPFKILDTLIKPRSSGGTTISSIFAAEKVKFPGDVDDIERVTVEVYKRAKDQLGTHEHHWHPDTKESADHSIPYIVAATLLDGTITPRSFDDTHLANPKLRTLLAKIEVVENPEFTATYERLPVQHRTRVTAVTRDGRKFSGESGGEHGDLSDTASDAQIESKFRIMTEDKLGSKRVDALLQRLWRLEEASGLSEIVNELVFV